MTFSNSSSQDILTLLSPFNTLEGTKYLYGLYPPQTWPQPWHGPSILFTLMSPQSWIFHTSSMLSLVHRTLNMIPLSCLPWYPPQTDESDTSLLLTYRMFIKYCVFSEVFKNIPDSGLSLFSLGVSVYAHQTGRKPALQQNWQSSEKSQNFKEKTQYLMNTL